MPTKKPFYAELSGFDLRPEGVLLNQFINDRSPYGVAYERAIGYDKAWHTHNRFNVAFPRGSSQIEFEDSNGHSYQVDSGSFMVMSPNVRHKQFAQSTVWDNFALMFTDGIFQTVTSATYLKQNQDVRVCRRTPLLDEVVQHLFVHSILKRSPSAKYRFTYLHALDLVFNQCHETELFEEQSVAGEGRTIAQQAVEYIENHLFETLDINTLVLRIGVSRASLFRNFRSLMGSSIATYIRRRRMEEARLLLGKHSHSVTEIALLIGYEDVYSFSKAYKKVFGRSPSKMDGVRA